MQKSQELNNTYWIINRCIEVAHQFSIYIRKTMQRNKRMFGNKFILYRCKI